MASVYQEFLGRFPIGASTDSFSIGTNAITLTAGNYYLNGYTGEATAQLCEHMQAAIRAATGGYANATVVRSTSTGLVSIATGGGTADITWTDSALQTLLGFTGTQTGHTGYTATRTPRYVWRPTDPPMDVDTTPEEMFSPVASCKVYRSQDGSMCAVDGVTVLQDCRRLAYQALPQNDVIRTVAGPTYTSLQEFWEDVIARGRPMRVYPDRSVNANSACFTTAVYGAEQPGAFVDTVGKAVGSYLGYWRVDLPLWKVS
jgi:hypothetical protein